MSDFLEILKNVMWQRKRLKIFNRDNWTCQECGETEGIFHVHHKKYTVMNPWDEPDENLSTVCSLCHEKLSFNKKNQYKDKELNNIVERMNELLDELEFCNKIDEGDILEEFFKLDLKKQERIKIIHGKSNSLELP